MKISEHLINYDNLSILVFSGLADNALDHISESAGKMLDVACLFFDRDVSSALHDFHCLYSHHSEFDQHKERANLQVDEILAAAQKGTPFPNTMHSDDDSEQLDESNFAEVQKNLEAFIQQDQHIKQRMIPIMQCMQYEDMISNRVKRLIQCWSHMVSLLNSPEPVDILQALIVFDSYLASEDEHIKFYRCVLQVDYLNIQASKGHEISLIPHNIDSVVSLSERLCDFSKSSLDDCIDQTQNVFEELMKLLSLITGESEDVAYLFADSNESLADIKSILINYQNADEHQAKQLLHEMAVSRKKHSKEADKLIQKFMVALQSQDIIRQNIENIGKFHLLWSEYRESIKQSENFNEQQRITFGNEVMNQMTSHAEREIIKQLIPGIILEESEDDDMFY